MIIAARPSYDYWFERWQIEVLVHKDGEAPKWKKSGPVVRNGVSYADIYSELSAAEERCSVINAEASLRIEQEPSQSQRISLRLKAEKSLQATKRLAQEERAMLVQARARKKGVIFDESKLILHKSSEDYRELIADELRQFPYLQLVLIRSEGRPIVFFRLENGSWSSPRYPNRKGLLSCHRAKIANGFDLYGSSHWGKTKAAIRQILLPRANELLKLAGIKRLLAEALAKGEKVLVYGCYVFWYETHKNVGWLVKELGSAKGSSDGEALWREGTIISQNHGRIVVLPYIKEDGVKVKGHTKNAPHEGPALPRHPDDIVEIPFSEIDGDLMIGLDGELFYE